MKKVVMIVISGILVYGLCYFTAFSIASNELDIQHKTMNKTINSQVDLTNVESEIGQFSLPQGYSD